METTYYGVTNMTETDENGRCSIFGHRVPMEFTTGQDADAYARMMGKGYRSFSTNRP
jgi:hypothetical protein